MMKPARAAAAAAVSLGSIAIAAGCFRSPSAAPTTIPTSSRIVEDRPNPTKISPAEALARMKLAPGLAASVFASEPDVRQPVALTWDDRGRLWVVEYLQYPYPAGLKVIDWDRYFRTKYDRIPEPPPKGPRGADRIKIFEDTNGDGKSDKVSTFVDGLNLATGVAVGQGGVFIAQTPYLLFYPDRDRDDRPDGPPEVCLEGFGMEDAHSLVNSLTWGPDGWLYGATGSTSTQHIRGQTFQQGIWRYHPRTKQFEVFAEGGGNIWSFDWDDEGHLFNGTNWDAVTVHMVQGGYYFKAFEKHGQLSNPYAFGYFQSIEKLGTFTAGGITIGAVMYQGDALPERFRGKLIAPGLLLNGIFGFDIDRQGSTFRVKHGDDVLTARDPSFRPVAMKTGPDGALYVADWYDLRASYNTTRADDWDKTSGRIYRVGPPERRPTATVLPLSKLSSADLVGLFRHPNEWFHREARRILAERREASILPALRDAVVNASGHWALENLWALYVSGGLDEKLALELLGHENRAVRTWVVRFLGDARQISPAAAVALKAVAAKDPDPDVRSQLASSARRLPARDATAILSELVCREEDASDRHIPLLLWWAIEQHVAKNREDSVDLLARPEAWKSRLVRAHLAERLARRLASSGSPEDFTAGARLLGSAPDRAATEIVLKGLELGLAGRLLQSPPPPLKRLLARLSSGDAPSPTTLRLAARMGDETARRKTLEIALEGGSEKEDRLAAISLLGQTGGPENRRGLLELLSRQESQVLLTEVIKALSSFAEPAVGDALLARAATLGPVLRERALDTLAGRKGWAAKLIAGLGPELRKQPLALVRKILEHHDPELTALLEKSWGRVRTSDQAEKARALAGIVGPFGLLSRPERKADLTRGNQIFTQRCRVCHQLFGEGAKIGPDLTAVDRRDINGLMLNIVDPSASILKEYTNVIVELRDGRVLTGFIADSTPEALTIADATAERTVVARADAKEIRESQLSLMPEGLLDGLDNQSLTDLFAYITSDGP